MTLSEAHTDNVKRAWEAYKADQGTPISWGPHGWLHTNHPGGHGNPTRTKIMLSQALDLLAWVASQVGSEACYPRMVWHLTDHAPRTEGHPWFAAYPDAADRERFVMSSPDHPPSHQALRCTLLAIDAIVKKHPEVVEHG